MRDRRGRRISLIWLATWFGVGYLPGAPGTWGSVAALPFWWLLQPLPPLFYLAVVLLLAFVAVFAGNHGIQHFRNPDPRQVVIDEVVGQLLALSSCPLRPGPVAAAFLLFRLLDIIKPFPARTCETQLAGGLGVLLDDVVAGFYTWVLLAGVLRLGWL